MLKSALKALLLLITAFVVMAFCIVSRPGVMVPILAYTISALLFIARAIRLPSYALQPPTRRDYAKRALLSLFFVPLVCGAMLLFTLLATGEAGLVFGPLVLTYGTPVTMLLTPVAGCHLLSRRYAMSRGLPQQPEVAD